MSVPPDPASPPVADVVELVVPPDPAAPPVGGWTISGGPQAATAIGRSASKERTMGKEPVRKGHLLRKCQEAHDTGANARQARDVIVFLPEHR